MKVAFVNGNLVLPDRVLQDGAVVCADGRIRRVGARSQIRIPSGAVQIDARGGLIAPGYVDIHLHGGAGADYMDGTAAAVRTVNRAHARHGTTAVFPTTTTGSPAQLAAMLKACAGVRRDWTVADGARLMGVHLYGPYFAEEKAGCHARRGCRAPRPAEYRAYLRQDLLRIATCAAELAGAVRFYRAAARRGCLVTCGHSNAGWEELERAYAAGMRHVDHFWCAMSSVASLRARLGTPMRGSMEQFVLLHPEMSTEVIADGCHLAPELLRFALAMKGPRRLCLVSDSSRALDMPPGRYRFGPRRNGTWFVHDGRVGRIPGGGLASSVVALDAMVRVMSRATGAPLHEVVRLASLTPAERAGVAREVGSLEAGKCADVILLDARLRVRKVFIGGELLADASASSRPARLARVA